MNNATNQKRVLALDVRPRSFGYVVFEGPTLLLDWGVLHAVFKPSPDACQAARGEGACWGVVAEKYRFFSYGDCMFID